MREIPSVQPVRKDALANGLPAKAHRGRLARAGVAALLLTGIGACSPSSPDAGSPRPTTTSSSIDRTAASNPTNGSNGVPGEERQLVLLGDDIWGYADQRVAPAPTTSTTRVTPTTRPGYSDN
ncbi:MAG TPA: hypothetical protein VLG67_02055 [Candidatus Saccharimonadales bacterium]|nr:hypothetical protein [Candidatus Saccharimonadales bacterium]